MFDGTNADDRNISHKRLGERYPKRIVKKFYPNASRIAMLLLPLAFPWSICGCAGAPVFTPGTLTPVSHGLSGTVFGGQQPVVGAQIQLFTVGTSGNGSTPTSILTTPVYTGTGGNFTLTSDYPCASPSELVYLTATEGQPTPGVTNSNLFLMAAIGSCSTLQSTAFVSINEITTVASIVALAPFMSSGGAVGASSTNAAGIANAFATVAELADVSAGSTPGPNLPAHSVLESQKIIALADVLASCINSDGTALCSSLFSAAAANGITPANVPDALVNIVRNPSANPGGVFSLITGIPPFATTMSGKPNDWSVTISYGDPVDGCTTGYLCAPTVVALDLNGNVWVDQYGGGVVEFSPLGVYQTTVTGGGMAESYGMAIDPSNQVWVTNEETRVNGSHGSLTTISAASASVTSGAGISGGGIYFPVGIGSAADGTIWVSDYGDSEGSELTSAAAIASGSPFGSGELNFPVAVAVDGNGTAWFADQSNSNITSISKDGSTVANLTCCNGASGIAVDSQQNVWVSNYFGDSVSEVASGGSVSTYYSSEIYHPQGIAIDGAGTVWVANYRGNTITEIAGASASVPGRVLTANGLGADVLSDDANQDAAMNEPFNLAVDSSGSIWVGNYGSDVLVRFIGMAIPVKTPLDGPVQIP